jgi:hypothetical protein
MALRDELHAPGPHLDPGPAGVAGPPRTSGGLSVHQEKMRKTQAYRHPSFG